MRENCDQFYPPSNQAMSVNYKPPMSREGQYIPNSSPQQWQASYYNNGKIPQSSLGKDACPFSSSMPTPPMNNTNQSNGLNAAQFNGNGGFENTANSIGHRLGNRYDNSGRSGFQGGFNMAAKGGCYWKDMWHKLDIMRQLWQLCDVTIFSSDDAMFMAHSPVLAASSDVFHSYFISRKEDNSMCKSLGERTMKLSNVSGEVLQVTLDFIYGITPTTDQDFEKLLTGAKLLGLNGATSYCKKYGRIDTDIIQNTNLPPEPANQQYDLTCPYSGHKDYFKDNNNAINSTVSTVNISTVTSNASECPLSNYVDKIAGNGSFDLRTGQDEQGVSGTSQQTHNTTQSNQIDQNRCSPNGVIVENSQLSKPINVAEIKNSSTPSPKPGTTIIKPTPPTAVPCAVEANTGKKAEYPILPVRNRNRPPKKSMELRDISFQEFLPANHPDIMSDKIALHGRCPVLHGGGASLDPMDADEVLATASVPILLEELESAGTPQSDSMDDDSSNHPNKNVPQTLQAKEPKGVKHFPEITEKENDEDSNMETSGEPSYADSNSSGKEARIIRCQTDGKNFKIEQIANIPFGSAPQIKYPLKSRGKPELYEYTSCPEWGSDGTMCNDSDENPGSICGNSIESNSVSASPNSPNDLTSHHGSYLGAIYSSSDGEASEFGDRGSEPTPREFIRQPLTEEELISVKKENASLVERLTRDGKQRFMCLAEGCGYANRHLDYLQSHMFHRHNIGHPDKQCLFCDHSYFSEGQLKTHVRRSHQDRGRINEGGGNKVCPDCGDTFTTGYTLQMHLLKAHGKGRLFTCEDCEFKSPRKKDMQAHMLSQHDKYPHGVRVFSCQHCNYKCVDRNRYEEHEAKHTGEQKYDCHICGKSYTTRRGMRTHLKYHSEERPHMCDICKACFKVRSKLKDHIRLVHTHAGMKPYQCGYCNHATALRGNCNQHIKKYHPGLPVQVIDLLKNQRKHVKDYNYAKYDGEHIQVTNDVTAASWASIGNAANFTPPKRSKKPVLQGSVTKETQLETSQDSMDLLPAAISKAIQENNT